MARCDPDCSSRSRIALVCAAWSPSSSCGVSGCYLTTGAFTQTYRQLRANETAEQGPPSSKSDKLAKNAVDIAEVRACLFLGLHGRRSARGHLLPSRRVRLQRGGEVGRRVRQRGEGELVRSRRVGEGREEGRRERRVREEREARLLGLGYLTSQLSSQSQLSCSPIGQPSAPLPIPRQGSSPRDRSPPPAARRPCASAPCRSTCPRRAGAGR